MNNRRILIAFLLIINILLLRDAPYINVFVIDKLWVVYILLILGIVFSLIPRKERYLWGVLFFLPLIPLILTLVRIPIAAEFIGVVFYSILWFTALFKIVSFVREKDKGDK